MYNFINVFCVCFSTGNMTEELPDTMGSLTRHASGSSADTPQDPNPLGVMEQQEAEKGSKRRKASAEDDPLVTGWAEAVGKIDRSHDIMTQLAARLCAPESRLTPRQSYVKYLGTVLDECTEEEYRLFRESTNSLINTFGRQAPVGVPPSTSLAHTYPVPSASYAPVSSYTPMTPGPPLLDLPTSLEQTLAELTSTASSQPTMSFLRTTLGTPDWDTHDPGAGPSGL